MRRSDRARLRLVARRCAYDFLGVDRLPKGVPAIVRGYADGFTVYPLPSPYGGDPMDGLRRLLRPYRKTWLLP